MLYFDWDPEKAAENIRRHRLSFESASVALEDPDAIEDIDQIVDGELRLRTIGTADGQVIVIVSHVNTSLNDGADELARIISARKASPGERRDYEQVRTQRGGNSAE